ncbi:MAG: PstS family phosphate ABC transporter substrate-binding protein [Phycisphaerales bacterium]|nr:PstS family phosphate ABC transporter substrate-binding protein [Phycisphaerales bacterium]
MKSIATLTLSLFALPIALAATMQAGDADLSKLTGQIKVDGSSTVYPITEAVAEDFKGKATKTRPTVGISGTGGGFKRFCAGETDISTASRPITKTEMDTAKTNKIEFVEIPIAFDGIAVVVNPANTWVTQMNVEQLKKIFSADSPAKKWSDINPAWPGETIKVFSPGTDSGTFDYFKEVTVGKDGKIRSDLSVSEDDNVLVTGVAGDKNAIGYFGFAFYSENASKLKLIPIDGGKGAITPNSKSIEDGTYAPLSRPLFIYVNAKSAARPEVAAFVNFYLANTAKLSKQVGYTPLPTAISERAATNWKAMKLGTQYLDASDNKVLGPIANVYK